MPKGITSSSAVILQYSMNLPKGPKYPAKSLFAQPKEHTIPLCVKILQILFRLELSCVDLRAVHCVGGSLLDSGICRIGLANFDRHRHLNRIQHIII